MNNKKHVNFNKHHPRVKNEMQQISDIKMILALLIERQDIDNGYSLTPEDQVLVDFMTEVLNG